MKYPDLKWTTSWVTGRMLGALSIGLFITLTVWKFCRQDWDAFFNEQGWYAWLVVIAANVLICILFGRGGKSGAASGTSVHGYRGENRFWTRVLFPLAFLALLVFFLWKGREYGWNVGQFAARESMGQGQSIPRHFFVTATPDAEVPVFIDTGMTCTNQLVHANEKVWVRRTGEDRFLYWKGKNVEVANLSGPHQIYFQSAERFPVIVQVDIYPRP